MTEHKNSTFLRFFAILAVIAIVANVCIGPVNAIAKGKDDGVYKLVPWSGETKADNPQITEALELVKNDHVALLKKAKAKYEKNVRDYTGTFYKHERIKGKLKKHQQIKFMFKEKPYSLLMEWQKNAGKIDKLLYVEGQNDNKMVVHPTGLLAWVKSAKRDPNCAEAKKSALHPCNRFGFNRIISRLLDVYEKADKKDDLQMKFIGETAVDNRRCAAFERLLPANKDYEGSRLIIEFDLEYQSPVAVTNYDKKGQLLSRYSFENLEFNTGLGDQRFSAKANNL